MTIFPWSVGKCLVWDFTCSDTLAASHIAASSVQPGKVAELAEQTKLTKYVELERDFQVVPVCVETMGPWGFHGLKFIQEVWKQIAAESGELQIHNFFDAVHWNSNSKTKCCQCCWNCSKKQTFG